MTDHGILGALIYPLLIYSITYPFKSENKYVNISNVAFLLIWGFFSHNILEQRFFLIGFALIATINQPTPKIKT